MLRQGVAFCDRVRVRCYGCGKRRLSFRKLDDPETIHTHISCEMVRAYVGQVGVMQARAVALAAGMTPAQERRAAHCLQEKI
jgi:hypothetical protein